MKKINIISHRGLYKGKYPENTLEAWKYAVETGGATAIECDAFLFADGEVGLLHPEPYRFGLAIRLPSYLGTHLALNGLTLAQARELRVGNIRAIPSLDEALELAARLGIRLYIEPKLYRFDSEGRLNQLIEKISGCIKKHGLTAACTIISFLELPHRKQMLKRFKKEAPVLRTNGIITNPWNNFLALARETELDEITLGFDRDWGLGKILRNQFERYERFSRPSSLPLADKLRALRKKDIGIVAGVVNHEKDLEWCFEREIDSFSTDNLGLFRKLFT